MIDRQVRNLLERPRLNKIFETELKKKKFIYVFANTGFGKTVSVLDYLKRAKKDFSYASAADESFFETIAAPEFRKKKIIVLDDVSFINDDESKSILTKYVAETKSKFFVLSRVALPLHLKPFLAAGQVTCLDRFVIGFTVDETKAFLEKMGVHLSETEIEEFTKDTYGLPLGISLIAGHIKDNKYTKEAYQEGKADYFDCLDTSTFENLTDLQRLYLLDLVSAEHFNVPLAAIITGITDIENQLELLGAFDNIIKKDHNGEYVFSYPEIREYFLIKQRQHLTKDAILGLYRRIGLYYELRNDLLNALKYYSKGDNREKVYSLLVENAKRNASSARFRDTEPYYLSLSEKQLCSSPDLMCGMSMLYSIRMDPEQSEAWYQKLKEFSESISKKDGRYKSAKDNLKYLDICLPHRGSDKIKDIIQNLSNAFSVRKVDFHGISVTGDMPSLMNGGKDFCHWSSKDKLLHAALKKPMETVLGKQGAGLADAALGESLFEKSTDFNFTEALGYLNDAMSQAEVRGTTQMQFAITGIMSRIFMASGNIDFSISMIERFRDKLTANEDMSMLPNINAWLTQLCLYKGDSERVKEWMQEDAPDENDGFYILSRLCYQTKCRVYIMNEQYVQAISLLSRLKTYYRTYRRVYGYIQALLLLSIANYKTEDERWKEELTEALDICEGYKFTRVIASEGIAILDPLCKLDYKGNKKYLSSVIKLTRVQAVNYPNYLAQKEKLEEALTSTEKSVLKLITEGFSNEKIANVLGITVRTVKYHTGNIYSKLGVKTRSEAIARSKSVL